jgi:hypothetical protein
VRPVSQAVVAGAGFTTFDATLLGCLDSPNGVNCNNYEAKDRVYMNGGPNHPQTGLADGDYYFTVVTPGEQNGGFIDGARGNLSDTVAGGTTGDDGSGDSIANRTFTVLNHQLVSYLGTHATGTSPNGRSIVGLAPFNDTDNAGGVYILAICQVGATAPAQCKYDAFRIQAGAPAFGTVAGVKYYDANTNGQRDPGEVGIGSWPISFADGVSGVILTDASGAFSAALTNDEYTFWEGVAGSPWMQTGNLVNQASASGGASVALNADKTYAITVVDNSAITGLNFGNICVGAGGGRTLGFWSNRNGAALFGSEDLALMGTLNLRNADGSSFDPASYAQFRTWLLSATAVNMAYMLSAQLAAMELNVFNGFVDGTRLIYAPGATGANVNGFATVNAVMAEANASLGTDGYTAAGSAVRTYQAALKNALDAANNNQNFVQPGPASCPTPVFP